MDDVTLFTEELLKQDYYYALLSYGNQCQFKTRKEMDRYHKLLPAINKLYNKGILSARLYDIANEVERYIAYGITYKDSETRSHTDGFQRNNAKCLDEKGISRFVPHSSI